MDIFAGSSAPKTVTVCSVLLLIGSQIRNGCSKQFQPFDDFCKPAWTTLRRRNLNEIKTGHKQTNLVPFGIKMDKLYIHLGACPQEVILGTIIKALAFRR